MNEATDELLHVALDYELGATTIQSMPSQNVADQDPFLKHQIDRAWPRVIAECYLHG